MMVVDYELVGEPPTYPWGVPSWLGSTQLLGRVRLWSRSWGRKDVQCESYDKIHMSSSQS